MKYEVKGNPNYAAKVIRVRTLQTLEGLDNLRGVLVDGYLALVSKNTPVDSLMVMFPAEAQLSEAFASEHSLHRDTTLNADPSVTTGYLEKHRRIKAIKLRGYVSSALLLPVWEDDMTEGLEFDTINGETISVKYEPPAKGNPNTPKTPKEDKLFGKVAYALPEHPDTAQFLREQHTIPSGKHIIVSQKIHGTSVRAAKVEVERERPWWQKLLHRPAQTYWAWAVGSRKVIKTVSGTGKESSDHWYAEGDIWTKVMAPYEALIPNGFGLYGEIYGYAPGSSTPIQKGYTYDAKPGEAKFVAYRVVNHGIDLGDAAAREWCAERGIAFVPKLWEGRKDQFVPELWMDQRFAEVYAKQVAGGVLDYYLEAPIPLAKESPVDEGVVVLVEGLAPKRYKCKGSLFYEFESRVLDTAEEVLS